MSTSLSSLDLYILDQLRIQSMGVGLSIGQEFQALREAVGSSGTALGLYRLFRDPHSSFDCSSTPSTRSQRSVRPTDWHSRRWNDHGSGELYQPGQLIGRSEQVGVYDALSRFEHALGTLRIGLGGTRCPAGAQVVPHSIEHLPAGLDGG